VSSESPTEVAGQTPWDVLKELYKREINAGIPSDWDSGFVVWIGGPRYREMSALPDEFVTAWADGEPPNHPFLAPVFAVTSFDKTTWDEIAPWMLSEAKKHFPEEFEGPSPIELRLVVNNDQPRSE
jgi:hypothetical protein